MVKNMTRSKTITSGGKAKVATKSRSTRVKATGPSQAKQKRALTAKKRKAIDLTQNDDDDSSDATAETSGAKKQKLNEVEKRSRPFRPKAPKTFLQKLERATSQRMIVIDRRRSGEGADLHEDIDVVGTTGNIYTVTIGRLPSCTCPDHLKGNECKHKVYALATILRATYELQYQRALLVSEVEEIFSRAPPVPTASDNDEKDSDGNRKPVEGECPICYMDFEPSNNELVWCKAACGNNMHKTCFDQWVTAQRGKEVKCVYCRTPWQTDSGDIASIKRNGEESGDGYINVADQFGMSRARDYSTYHQAWVRRTFGYR